MSIANVELTNTFDDWRTRTNQLVYQSNFYEVVIPDLYLRSNSTNANVASAFSLANTTNVRVTNSTAAINTYWQTTLAGANAAVGLGANAFASATIAGANAYWQATMAGANTAVGAGANAYANLVWSRSNTYMTATVAGANAYWQTTMAGANTAVGNGANNYSDATFIKINSGTILSARLSGSYTGITGLGTITVGSWASTAIPVANGGTGAITAGAARTNLGIGNNATRNVFVNTSAPTVGSGADGDIWYKI
jgi:hypothetical protein